MKKIILSLAVLGFLSSCSSLGPAWITMAKDPMSTHRISTDKQKISTKEGKSCGFNILGLVAFGDLTIETAQQSKNITEITSVETEISGVMYPPVLKRCTIVKGN